MKSPLQASPVSPLLLAAILTVTARGAEWQNYQDASLIIGRKTLPTASTLYMPQTITINPASGKAYVVDCSNNRVLRYSSAAAIGNGQAAEAVFGQPDLTSSEPGLSQTAINAPEDAAVDAAGRLWVSDTENQRVLRWDNADTAASGAAAAQVLGQTTFTNKGGNLSQTGITRPGGLAVDSLGRLWVVDYFANRVLRYDNPSSKGNGGAADGVIGQPDYTSSGSGTSATQLNYPYDVTVDALGHLWIVEFVNARVLRYDAPASKIQPAANGVLGQANMNTATTGSGPAKLNHPAALTVSSSGSLFVADTSNNRVLRWDNAAAKADGADADGVLGRGGLEANASYSSTGAQTSPSVRGLATDAAGRLWVVDRDLDRVMRWDNAAAKPNGAAADGVIGQASTVATVDAAFNPATMPRSARHGYDDPASGKFFLADQGRVLRYASRAAAEAGTAPEASLGKASMTDYGGGSASATNLRSTWNLAMDSAGKLWVSDPDGNRVVAFPNAATAATGSALSVVLGQAGVSDTSAALSQTRMNQPRGLSIDKAGNLYVADYGNHRVLRFNNIANKASGAAADAVLGQQDYITASTVANAALMNNPSGVATDAQGHLWVADTAKNRILRYDTPLTAGPLDPASGTLGNGASTTASGMNQPTSLAIGASGSLWVMDNSFNRALRFDNAAAKANGAAADGVIGAPNFTSYLYRCRNRHAFARPEVLFLDGAENLWIGDAENFRVMKFAPRASAVITESGLNAAHKFTFTFHGEADVPYTVESSTDLQNWEEEEVYTLASAGEKTFVNKKTGPRRFFRVVAP